MKHLIAIFALFVLLISSGCTKNGGMPLVVLTVETDKSEYVESDTVFFKIYISNHAPTVVELQTHESMAYDVFVFRNNEEIWHWMWDRYTYPWGETFYIDPGDTLIFGEEYPIYWTQLDYDSVIVSRGTYRAVAEFDADYKMQSEPFLFKLK